MSYKAFDVPVTVTGITISGTSDASGAWSAPINIRSIIEASGNQWVSGSGAAIIRVFNDTGAGSSWAGLRVPSKPHEYQASLGIGNATDILVTLNGGELIEFYAQRAEVKFSILGLFGGGWVWFQTDGRQSLASTGSSWLARTAAGIPANAWIVTNFAGTQWRPVGQVTSFTSPLSSSYALMQLNASSQVEVRSSTDTAIKGYTVSQVTGRAWLSSSFVPTADGTWRDSPITVSPGKTAILGCDKSTTAAYFLRAKGSTFDRTLLARDRAVDELVVAPSDSSGVFQYKIASAAPFAAMYVLGEINAPQEAEIISIDQLHTGQTSTANFNADFSATTFTITDGVTSKNAVATSVDGDTKTFLVPAWADGETALSIGPVSVTATDGTFTTDPFAGDLEFYGAHPDDPVARLFTVVELISLDAGRMDVTPPLQVGAQVVFDSSRFDVTNGGVLTSGDDENPPYLGESYIWYRNPDDKIARRVTLTTQEGEITGSTTFTPISLGFGLGIGI